MREFKFRAWDNVKDKMYHIGEEENISFSFNSSGIVAEDLTEHDWGFKKLEHLKYMQCTGLKDKNGIEIYEGDVLEDFINKKRYEVIWDDYGLFLFSPVGKLGEGIDYYEFEDEASSATIVVGNIYENPKLLGETK